MQNSWAHAFRLVAIWDFALFELRGFLVTRLYLAFLPGISTHDLRGAIASRTRLLLVLATAGLLTFI